MEITMPVEMLLGQLLITEKLLRIIISTPGKMALGKQF